MSKIYVSLFILILILILILRSKQELFDTLLAPLIDKPFYLESDCEMRADQLHLSCGKLYVDAHRGDNPQGTVILPVVRILPKNDTTTSTAPLLNIDGGPGSTSLLGSKFNNLWNKVYQHQFAEWLGNRELILFDQRGSGIAEPGLHCPEELEAVLDPLLQGQKTLSELNKTKGRDAIRRCFERLQRSGIDTHDYQVDNIVTDIEQLRQALGIKRWHLLGGSYGSKIALHLMDLYPETITSAILDSPQPPDTVGNGITEEVKRVLHRLEQRCNNSGHCNQGKLALADQFEQFLLQLKEAPVWLTAKIPGPNNDATVLLDEQLALLLFIDLLNGQTGEEVIQSLAEFNRQQFNQLQKHITDLYINERYFNSSGSYYSIACGDPSMNDPLIENECDFWPHKKQTDAWTSTVSSEVPALLLAGELDAQTPITQARRTAQQLSNSYLFEFTNVGHGVLSHNCAKQLAKQFLDDPMTRPNPACLQQYGRRGYLGRRPPMEKKATSQQEAAVDN